MEKLAKLWTALIAMLTLPVEQRDQDALNTTLKETKDFIDIFCVSPFIQFTC